MTKSNIKTQKGYQKIWRAVESISKQVSWAPKKTAGRKEYEIINCTLISQPLWFAQNVANYKPPSTEVAFPKLTFSCCECPNLAQDPAPHPIR